MAMSHRLSVESTQTRLSIDRGNGPEVSSGLLRTSADDALDLNATASLQDGRRSRARSRAQTAEAARVEQWGNNKSVELVLKQGFELQGDRKGQLYALVSDGHKVMSSRLSVSDSNGNPFWNEYFMFPLDAGSQVLVISIWEKRKGGMDKLPDDFVGVYEIPLTQLPRHFHRRCPPLWSKDMSEPVGGAILFKVGFTEDKCDYFPCQRDLNDQGADVFTTAIRGKVSKKKKRFQEHGFDLDLSYITKRLIAMGFPSIGIESTYRNRMQEVQRFFNTRHLQHYHVYNLCSERQYDKENFNGCVTEFGFDDHNPCPLALLKDICEALYQWLGMHPQNVAAIHCKAGKGRTGLVISSYLVYSGQCKTARAALELFGNQRTSDGKGVTIPSQKRYVGYVEACVTRAMHKSVDDGKYLLPSGEEPEETRSAARVNKSQPSSVRAAETLGRDIKSARSSPTVRSLLEGPTAGDSEGSVTSSIMVGGIVRDFVGWEHFPPRILHIHKVSIHNFDLSSGQDVFLEVRCKSLDLHYRSEKSNDTSTLLRNGAGSIREWNPKPIHVSDDVKVLFYTRSKGLGRKGKLFHFWFNTRMHSLTSLTLIKPDIDDACKKEKFPEDLMIRLDFKPDKKSRARGNIFAGASQLTKPSDAEWKEIDYTEKIKDSEKVMDKLREFGHENLVWAGLVKKWSTGRAVFQPRILVLSSAALYNFKMEKNRKKSTEYSYSWRFTYEALKYITCSTDSDQFVLHLPLEKQDYLFTCPHNTYICQMMSNLVAVTSGRDKWVYVDMVQSNLHSFHTQRKNRNTRTRQMSVDRKIKIRNNTPWKSRFSTPFAPLKASAFVQRWTAIGVHEVLMDSREATPRAFARNSTLSPTAAAQYWERHVRGVESIVNIISGYCTLDLRSVRAFRIKMHSANATLVVLGADTCKDPIPEQLEVDAAGIKFKVTITRLNYVDEKSAAIAAAADCVIFAYTNHHASSLDNAQRAHDMVVAAKAAKWRKETRERGHLLYHEDDDTMDNDFPHILANLGSPAPPPKPSGVMVVARRDRGRHDRRRHGGGGRGSRSRSRTPTRPPPSLPKSEQKPTQDNTTTNASRNNSIASVGSASSGLLFSGGGRRRRAPPALPSEEESKNQKRRMVQRNGQALARQWNADYVGAAPSDPGEWSLVLNDIMRRVAMEQSLVYEGMINIKHQSWKKPKISGVFFYRIVKAPSPEGPDEAEMAFYNTSQATPWEEPCYILPLEGARLWPSSNKPLVSTLSIQRKDKDDKYHLFFASQNAKAAMHNLISRCSSVNGPIITLPSKE